MKFHFKAKTEAGKIQEGFVDAINRDAAIELLQTNHLIPLALNEEQVATGYKWLRDMQKLWEGASPKEIMVVFRQLATLIQARVPVVTSLQTISDQLRNPYLRLILKEMEDDIEDGMAFSEALEKHPKVFTSMTVNMIRAGEISGNLQHSIEFVADSIEKNYLLASKIKGALYYPGFVLFVAAVIGFLVTTLILPKLTILIKDLNVTVPWYTSMLIGLGDFMSQFWWAVLIVVIAAAVSFVYYIQTPNGKRDWDIAVLKIPVFKTLAHNVYITRFAENLASLLNAGIPVVKALIITSDVMNNHVYEKIILRAAEGVKTGGAISSTLFRYPNEVPSIVAQIVKIGEETGTMTQVLKSAADFYNAEVEAMTRNLTILIEPVLIVILGIGVAILAVGILVPIYNIAGQL